jgi:hypothetical protein
MQSHNWPELVKGNGMNKMAVNDIKAFCKEHKLAQTGEKASMIARIKYAPFMLAPQAPMHSH